MCGTGGMLSKSEGNTAAWSAGTVGLVMLSAPAPASAAPACSEAPSSPQGCSPWPLVDAGPAVGPAAGAAAAVGSSKGDLVEAAAAAAAAWSSLSHPEPAAATAAAAAAGLEAGAAAAVWGAAAAGCCANPAVSSAGSWVTLGAGMGLLLGGKPS